MQDRTALLAASLALGVLAKETVVLMVPAYWACYWRGGVRPLLKAAALGVVCVAAFLAARVPFGWAPGYGQINGTQALMILDNLGFPPPDRPYQPAAPISMNYLHPALFVLPFVPFIAWGWRRIDARLKALVPGADAAGAAEQPVLRLDVRVAQLHAAAAAAGDGGAVRYPISVTEVWRCQVARRTD